MKVAATKTMAKEIQKNAVPGISISYIELSPDRYNFTVGDAFYNDIDYIESKGKMRTIRVDYSPELYALPAYLTTKELNRIFTRSDKTYTGFFAALNEEIEV